MWISDQAMSWTWHQLTQNQNKKLGKKMDRYILMQFILEFDLKEYCSYVMSSHFENLQTITLSGTENNDQTSKCLLRKMNKLN